MNIQLIGLRLLLMSFAILHSHFTDGQEVVSMMKLDKSLDARGALGGVSVDRLGYIYVANFYDAVWKISPEGQVSLLTNSLYGSSGNTIDEEGNLYQGNFYANTVTKIDRLGNSTTYADDGLKGPVGMIFDKQGNLLVCNCSGNFISQVSKSGKHSIIASGELFNCPNGITSDDDGNLYVANFGNDNIIKITPEGEASLFSNIPGGEGNAHLVYYKNNFYVTKIKTNQVFRVSPSGKYKLLAGTGNSETKEGLGANASLSRPNGIGVNAANGILYINTINGQWQSSEPTTIDISTIKLVTLTEKMTSAIDKGGVEAGKKAFWEYKNDPMHEGEDVGPETGTLAWRYMSQLNVTVANALFTLMTEAYPERWRPWYYLGEVQKIIGKLDKAIPYYNKALERDPENTIVKGRLSELSQDKRK